MTFDRERLQTVDERCANLRLVTSGCDEQALPGDGREWHTDYEFRVVGKSHLLIRARPGKIEDEFAARMRFLVTGSRAKQSAVRPLDDGDLRQPAGRSSDALPVFERRQEFVTQEWPSGIREDVPLHGRYVVDRR